MTTSVLAEPPTAGRTTDAIGVAPPHLVPFGAGVPLPAPRSRPGP